MNGFERRTERKKGDIRRAALELFRDFGVEKVTVAEIARRAAVSPVTIYNHFGNKEDLVRDVVKGFILGMIERYQEVMSSHRPFLDKIEFIVLDKTQIAHDYNKGFMQKIVSDDPEIRHFIDSTLKSQTDRLMLDLLETGQRQGYIDPALSPQMFLLYTDIFRQGILAHPGLFAAPGPDAQLVRDLLNLYLHGVMGIGGREPARLGTPERS